MDHALDEFDMTDDD